MSAVYPKFRQRLLEWSVAGTPAGMTYHALAVKSTYVYSASHETDTDLGANVISDVIELENVTFVDGVLAADETTLTGFTPGDGLDGVVVVLTDQSDEFHLVCYIDESTDGSIPQTVDATLGEIRWNASGICRI